MASTQKEISWPFTKAADESLLFGPLGRYGTRYIVPDDATRARIWNNVCWAHFGWCMATGLLRLIDSILAANGLSREQRAISSFVTWNLILLTFLVAVALVFRQTKGLIVAVGRPSMREACVLCANRWKPFQIWIVQGLAIFLALVSICMFTNPHVVNRTIGLIYDSSLFAIGISAALFCSYLLSIRNPLKVEVLKLTDAPVRVSEVEPLYDSHVARANASAIVARQSD